MIFVVVMGLPIGNLMSRTRTASVRCPWQPGFAAAVAVLAQNMPARAEGQMYYLDSFGSPGRPIAEITSGLLTVSIVVVVIVATAEHPKSVRPPRSCASAFTRSGRPSPVCSAGSARSTTSRSAYAIS